MTCALCGGDVAAFETYGIPPRAGRCPRCGCKGRHRALALLAREVLLPKLPADAAILEVGPTPSLLPRLAALWGERGGRYTAVDVRPLRGGARLSAPHRFLVMDARVLEFPDASFDLVLCSNTLSFVREDAAALAELKRVLKPGGLALLTVHREPGPTLPVEEWSRLNPDRATPEYLEENGTAWYYGDDYESRLAASGFASTALRPARGPKGPAHGIRPDTELTAAATSAAALTKWVGER